ncbi:Gfo/Idh/MocA family protein [Yoonia sediminilitoris]|uniref:Putative dehydrogenase n=1 Tax=Yoonia sediminilitoris TaxID=1286148 RepID=A0A2T6K4K0_9RHOB|nr:Gfo/Idh/MocA family oxidoreductase [Yoonia sediminilitoris]PUB09541.1 putative dehydrogenase [Yoonia sediminilitoris]RCW89496.1 putative dehydrogenase [Yoonia sediminilitoris]
MTQNTDTTAATIRAAVIGAGHFAYRVHIPVLQDRPEVVLDSVCRLGADDLALIRDEFGFAFASEDWRDILARDIDIAVIATPHHLHFEQAMAFLEKGCHVLVEKPMCLNPDEAWALVEKAKEVGRELLVSYGWHYKPGLKTARDLLGRIGKIEHVLCHMGSFTRSVFAGSGGASRWEHIKIQPEAETWQNADAGGGFAYGQLSHAMGLLFWLTDLRCESVGAITLDAPSRVDLHDAAVTRFSNGATGVFSGTCGVPQGHGFEVDIRIYGETGSLLIDIETERMILKLPDGSREDHSVAPGTWFYSCEGPANALVDVAMGKGGNESPGDVGARAVETLHALVTSAKAGGSATPINMMKG